MEKRGSHVDIVLSFVIFVTFVVFVIVIVQSPISFDSKDSLRASLRTGLAGEVSDDLTTVSMALDNTGSPTCVELVGFFTETEMGSGVIVQNGNGLVLDARVSSGGENLFVTKTGSDDFLRIEESDEFEQEAIGSFSPCTQLNEGDTGYDLGLLKTTQRAFETKIVKLINDYNSDYQGTKENLGVGSGDEFGFNFTYSNGTTIGTQEREITGNVFVDEISVSYVNKTASTQQGFLTIRTW